MNDENGERRKERKRKERKREERKREKRGQWKEGRGGLRDDICRATYIGPPDHLGTQDAIRHP